MLVPEVKVRVAQVVLAGYKGMVQLLLAALVE